MVKPPRARTARTMRPISSGSIEVPVGLEGLASSTPRVRAPQAASTPAASSWKRCSGPAGSSTGTPSAAATKWRLQG